MSDDTDNDEWNKWWDARVAAIEKVLGKVDDMVYHATVPFMFGPDAGGAADVIRFRQHLDGVVYVTSELIGCDSQLPSSMGNYELMICQREESNWGPSIISRLANYTLETAVEPGQTMSIDSAVPNDSTINAFLFDSFADFEVLDREAGLLLCLGITRPELNFCHANGADQLLKKLKAANIYPFTDLNRKSLV